jgi:chemotaxis protein methyltransferase CheR
MDAVREENEFNALIESIRLRYGYDFTDYAESSVRRRTFHFMESEKIDTLTSLNRMLLNDETLFISFVQGLSVTVTEMFRDPDFYRTMREKVLRRLATYPVIKIWLAGIATGEEVYSMAILLKEEGLLERSVIYATDINEKSVRIAKQGIYPLDHMKLYTQNYLASGGRFSFSEYYRVNYDSVLFDKTLKEKVVFSLHNLAVDKSFNEFQLIICRNVIMYFKQQLQDKVIDLFHDSLCNFGFIGLGDKESLLFSGRKHLFEEMDKKNKIYMKLK